MARIPVGGTATVDQLGKVATPGASAVLYLTRLGGTPIADVIDEAGAAIPGGIITIPADGIFPLVRPEVGALTAVWVSVNGGPRQWLPAHNLGAGSGTVADVTVSALINDPQTTTAAALQDAMGITPGDGTADATRLAINLTRGYDGNAIAPGLRSASILGGGQPGFNNTIGWVSQADLDQISTAAHPDRTPVTGSNAHYSQVAGYDNHAGAIASIILSMHSWTAPIPGCTHPTIVGGSLHKIRNGEYAAILGGTNHDVSASYVGIIGGMNGVTDATSYGVGALGTRTWSATDSQGTAFLAGQQLEAVSAQYGSLSGLRARLRHYGGRVHASGYFANIGDAQAGDYLLRRQAATAAASTLALDGAGALLTLQDEQAVAASIIVVAKGVGVDLAAAWRIDVAARRGTGASTTRLLGTPAVTSLGGDSGTSAWAPDVRADTTSGDLRLTFAGDGSTTIRVQARVTTCEVIG